MTQDVSNTKSPVVAYLLWFFLGGFGAHRFYMGRIGSGLGMLGLTLASAVLSVVAIGLVGYLAVFAWWVADAFLMNKWLKGSASAVTGESYAGQSDQSEPPMSQAA